MYIDDILALAVAIRGLAVEVVIDLGAGDLVTAIA